MTRVRSIRRELVVWLAAGLAVAVAAAAIATYLRAREEANEIFDYQLRQMAASLTGVPLAGTPGGIALGDDALVVQIWDRNGVQLFLSEPHKSLPQYAQLGFNTVSTASGDWRVFSTLAGNEVVQVAQPMSARRELAASMALRTIVPLLLVAPLLALFVGLGITRGLAPLARLAAAVGKRTPGGLEPVEEAGLPNEVRPLAHALNGLLARLDRALGAQRAFIADAAHELRTPLTAVNLQAQLAERAVDDDSRRAALAELRAGLTRATHLVEQMLTLAREEPGVADRGFAPVNLTELARSVVAEHAAIAAARNVDLGMAGAAADTAERSARGRPGRRHRAARARVELGRQRRPLLAARRPHRRHRRSGTPRCGARRPRFGPGHSGGRAGARVRPLLPCARPSCGGGSRQRPRASRSSSASPSATRRRSRSSRASTGPRAKASP